MLPRRVSDLPFFLKPFGELARKVLLRTNLRLNPYFFESDGMATNHNVYFLNNENFKNSYSRAVKGVPFDYMIPWRVHQAIWCANYAQKLSPNSVFVEIGTGRGFVMSAVLASFDSSGEKKDISEVLLFDTFSPYATDGVSRQGEEFGNDPHYTSNLEETKLNFSEWSNVKLVQGQLPATLDALLGKSISFLHIDLNAARVEEECLEKLWDQIVDYGAILIDDFANAGFPDTARILGSYLEQRGQSILITPSGQGIVLKTPKS